MSDSVVEVLGVVSAGGAAGLDEGKGWSVVFEFAAWRYVGGEVQTRSLRLQQPGVTEREMRRGMKAIKAYDILHVRLQIDPAGGRGTVHQVLTHDASDSELKAIAAKLQEPVRLHDPQFGVFTLDQRLNWFEARTAWGAEAVRLVLAPDNPDHVAPLLSDARRVWAGQQAWDQRVRAFVVGRMINELNEVWLADGKPMSPDEFSMQITLHTVLVYTDGLSFDFSADERMFGGHDISVRATLADGPEDVELIG
jgi:hypothetical protein